MLVFVLWDLRGKGAGMLRRRCEGSARDGEAGGHEGGAPQSGATSVQRRIRLARSPTRGVREVWTYTRWTAGWAGQARRGGRRHAHVASISVVSSMPEGGIAVTSVTTPQAMSTRPMPERQVKGSFITVVVMMPFTKTLVAPMGATIEAGA
eukprot:scaffold55331_cov23-Tisochrysis_lutea.AAC.2